MRRAATHDFYVAVNNASSIEEIAEYIGRVDQNSPQWDDLQVEALDDDSRETAVMYNK